MEEQAGQAEQVKQADAKAPTKPTGKKASKAEEIAAVKAAMADALTRHNEAKRVRAESEKEVRTTEKELGQLKDKLIGLLG